jgi:large subunit ribosomal protein L3
MAGQWGDERVTVQNLEVIQVRSNDNLLLVKGSVPGAANGVVLIRHSVKVKKNGSSADSTAA